MPPAVHLQGGGHHESCLQGVKTCSVGLYMSLLAGVVQDMGPVGEPAAQHFSVQAVGCMLPHCSKVLEQIWHL